MFLNITKRNFYSLEQASITHRAFLTGKNANLELYKTVFVNAEGMLQLNSVDVKEYGYILDTDIENNLFLLRVWKFYPHI